MKDIFGTLTERRIQEAISRGEHKNLSGAGKPLKIENIYFLPQELRAAYIVLKNSGYLDSKPSESDRSDDLSLKDVIPSTTTQELSEYLYKYNVMRECKHRR